MKTAIELHDQQVKRSQRWSFYLPLWVAGITGAVSIFKALLAHFAR